MKQMGLLQTASLLKFIPIPPGEDDTFSHRNNAILLSESKKSKPNPTVVETLMKIMFPIQRNDILAGRKDLHSILLDYLLNIFMR